MAPTSTPQDDYYAQMQSKEKSGNDDKKPLKIKLKTIIKKSSNPGETIGDIESQEEKNTTVPPEHTSKSRLVEREHAGE